MSVKIFLLKLKTVSEQKYPDILSLLQLEVLDGDCFSNSSKIEIISSSSEDNILASSTTIESDALEKTAELVQIMGGETSIFEVFSLSSLSNCSKISERLFLSLFLSKIFLLYFTASA